MTGQLSVTQVAPALDEIKETRFAQTIDQKGDSRNDERVHLYAGQPREDGESDHQETKQQG
jgi:hypothetical protein